MTDNQQGDKGLGVSGGGDYDEDWDNSDCWQCGGEGFVYGCSWDWQCDTWDGDSCLCTRRCDVCNPAPRNPELVAVLGDALAPNPQEAQS